MAPDSFEDREKIQENKFARDEEYAFRLNAQAVRLFGAWLAGQMARGEAYVEELAADFTAHGLEHVMARAANDARAVGMDMTPHHLENQYAVHVEEAKALLAR